MKYWAGIGSRSTPKLIQNGMTYIATQLYQDGYTLRSGNAIGADQAFAKGSRRAQIWLPYKEFNQDFQDLYPTHTYKTIDATDVVAFCSILSFHPDPDRLKEGGRNMMARNYRQIVGKDEPDSDFVVCWTQEGKQVGGTSQAMRIANSLGIPIFNMFFLTPDEVLQEIKKYNLIS